MLDIILKFIISIPIKTNINFDIDKIYILILGT